MCSSMETRQSDLLAQKTQGNRLVSQKAQPRCSTEAGADTDTMLHVPARSLDERPALNTGANLLL